MRVVGVALLLACNHLLAAEPSIELFAKREFNAATFATAVNHLVDIGETAAIRELLAGPLNAEPDLDAQGRASWLLRVLYLPKANVPLRKPGYGALVAPAPEEAFAGWPLFPLVRSGDTYFVLSVSYVIAGQPEAPRHYLEYCRDNGTFRKSHIPVPIRARALEDAAALRDSPQWRAIRWSAQGMGWSYSASEEDVWAFVRSQAETIDTLAK